MKESGECYTNIVESVIDDIKNFVDLNKKFVVLRSTVPPGTSNRLNCYFMPEFLTEKNYEYDFINNKEWIFGIKNNKQDNEFKKIISNLINNSYNSKKINYKKITFIPNSDAEMVKLFRNNFLALKVSFCNEIYEFCQKKDINYENVRKYGAIDSRIGSSHTGVPGHDGKFGFGGTCFPKDTNSLNYEMKKANMKSFIISAAIERNNTHDRKEQDWNNNKGRAVV